jgi:hypothetical protein
MESDGIGDLDSFLALVDSSETILLQDDDGGGERNAQMVFTLPTAGRYYLVATRYSTDTGQTSGGFLLSFFESATGSGGAITPASTGSVQVMGGGANEPWTAAPLIAPGMVVGNTIDNTNWAGRTRSTGGRQTLTIRMESDAAAIWTASWPWSTAARRSSSRMTTAARHELPAHLHPARGGALLHRRHALQRGHRPDQRRFVLSYLEGGSAPSTGGHAADNRPGRGHARLHPDSNLRQRRPDLRLRGRPYAIDLVAGGDVNAASALGGACTGQAAGFVAQAPDFRLNYTSGSYALRVFFTGNGDTTLVINAPDGLWYCDDDSGGSGHPLINFGSPLTGQYDIWVGSFQSGQFVEGTLTITERDLMPGASTSKAGGGLIDNWK